MLRGWRAHAEGDDEEVVAAQGGDETFFGGVVYFGDFEVGVGREGRCAFRAGQYGYRVLAACEEMFEDVSADLAAALWIVRW